MSRAARRFSFSVLLLCGATLATPADEGRPRPTNSFAVSTERVKVDVVVRDKNGAILRGLTAADLEVYEDGVRQTVDSFDFVDGRAVEPPAAPGSAAAATPPAFVAVAFDRLGPAARSFAQQAAQEYLDRALPARSWVGVFSIDRGLSTLQRFTDDRDALRRSLVRAARGASASFAGLRERDAIRNAYAGLATGFGQAHVAAAELSGVPECRSVEDEVVRRLELLDSRLMEGFESLERDQQGFATTHALLALIGALEPLPGRKAILLFSEGLAIPADVEASFVSLVAAANRANVSIYGADAGGLRAASDADETRRTIDSLQTRLQLQDDGAGNPLSRGGSARDPATSGLVLLERNEDTLRLDPGSGLGRLADQTGGFLIRGTNDLSAGLAEMSEDLGAYYLLSYTPRNEDYDGRFRTIKVKLKRPHGRLQARNGYLAVKTELPVPALDYEAPALARLESGPLPGAVSLRLRGLQFPEEPPLSVVPVMVEVPARGLRDLTIVVLVRDASGRVAAKMSQRYTLSGPDEPPEAARRLFFYREARLSPGSYELVAIAYDARSGAAGAATSRLEVLPAASGRLRASSLMVVGSAAKLGAGESAAPKPLRYGDVLLHPNLGQPVRREADRTLTFFMTAWPASERPAIDARLEVVRDGRTVSTTRSTSLRPDAEGRIQLASSLPLDRFAPGAYELRLTLTDGQDEQVRTAAVPIAP
ncbi:MAG TPA: VWA domain-containing protein [Vicinamibacteria bacterium]